MHAFTKVKFFHVVLTIVPEFDVDVCFCASPYLRALLSRTCHFVQSYTTLRTINASMTKQWQKWQLKASVTVLMPTLLHDLAYSLLYKELADTICFHRAR